MTVSACRDMEVVGVMRGLFGTMILLVMKLVVGYLLSPTPTHLDGVFSLATFLTGFRFPLVFISRLF